MPTIRNVCIVHPENAVLCVSFGAINEGRGDVPGMIQTGVKAPVTSLFPRKSGQNVEKGL